MTYKNDRWVEIPYADMELHNALWMRTMHGGDERHFAFKFNADGTMSPEEKVTSTESWNRP